MPKSFAVASACLAAAFALTQATTAVAQTLDPSLQIPMEALQTMNPGIGHPGDISTKPLPDGINSNASNNSQPAIDTLKYWSDQFTAAGFDLSNNPKSVWPYQIVGTAPETGHTTIFKAPIIPVNLDLLDKTGKVAVSFNVGSDIVQNVLESPIFEPWFYTSGVGQLNDQMQRAEFWNRIHPGKADNGPDEDWDNQNGWHNILAPSVKTGRRMQIPFGSWKVFVDANGNPIAADVDENTFNNLLFPATFPFDNSTPVGAAELAGDITTHDISTFLFNNVFLYQNGNPNLCCVVGYHTYDFEPGIPSNGNRPRLYVLDFASWTRSGFFAGGAEDITAMSHEISEIFNDPFVDNEVPWWLSKDRFFGAQCSPVLEVGDVIEVKSSNQVFPISMNGRTYHPQNEALFPWFADESPSPAHLGAYSFPDETTLLALSPHPLHAGCQP